MPRFQLIERPASRPAARARRRADDGPRALGAGGVEHDDGDARAHERQGGGRVQHLGAEGGELRRLLVARRAQRARRRHDARVGGHEAVDVGPDLDPFGVERRAEQRGGEVGAAAAQRGRRAVDRGADEALGDRDPAGGGQREQALARARRQRLHVRRRPTVAVVGHHERTDVDPGGGQTRASTPRPPAGCSTARPGRPRASSSAGRSMRPAAAPRSRPSASASSAIAGIALAPPGRPQRPRRGGRPARRARRDRAGVAGMHRGARPSNVSVTLASALTTIRGRSGTRERTIADEPADRAGVGTDVPPNLATIMPVRRHPAFRRAAGGGRPGGPTGMIVAVRRNVGGRRGGYRPADRDRPHPDCRPAGGGGERARGGDGRTPGAGRMVHAVTASLDAAIGALVDRHAATARELPGAALALPWIAEDAAGLRGSSTKPRPHAARPPSSTCWPAGRALELPPGGRGARGRRASAPRGWTSAR